MHQTNPSPSSNYESHDPSTTGLYFTSFTPDTLILEREIRNAYPQHFIAFAFLGGCCSSQQ